MPRIAPRGSSLGGVGSFLRIEPGTGVRRFGCVISSGERGTSIAGVGRTLISPDAAASASGDGWLPERASFGGAGAGAMSTGGTDCARFTPGGGTPRTVSSSGTSFGRFWIGGGTSVGRFARWLPFGGIGGGCADGCDRWRGKPPDQSTFC